MDSETRKKSVVEGLIPEHIAEQMDVPTSEIVDAVTTYQDPDVEKEKDDAKMQSKYSFDFSWVSPRGNTFEGEFTNKILTIGEKQTVGAIRAKLAAGYPASSFDELTIEINYIVAHMSVSLVERPEWAEDLRNLQDVELLQRIYREVASHEATFFGYEQAEGDR